MSTFMIDRETSLTLELTQQGVVGVRKFKIQPRPSGQPNNGRTNP